MELIHNLKVGPRGDFRLAVWEPAGNTMLNNRLGYRLTDPAGVIIFEGEDMRPTPSEPIDSMEHVYDILTFLTLRPGDTDEDYFKDYNSIQNDFVEYHAEELANWTYEMEIREIPLEQCVYYLSDSLDALCGDCADIEALTPYPLYENTSCNKCGTSF